MTISWGEVKFDGPTQMDEWDPPNRAGVYAIMMRPDPRGDPNSYRILYFGESGNMADRGFWRAHHRFVCWLREAGSTANIYIGTRLMPGSSAAERHAAETKLIDRYNPACNRE